MLKTALVERENQRRLELESASTAVIDANQLQLPPNNAQTINISVNSNPDSSISSATVLLTQQSNSAISDQLNTEHRNVVAPEFVPFDIACHQIDGDGWCFSKSLLKAIKKDTGDREALGLMRSLTRWIKCIWVIH